MFLRPTLLGTFFGLNNSVTRVYVGIYGILMILNSNLYSGMLIFFGCLTGSYQVFFSNFKKVMIFEHTKMGGLSFEFGKKSSYKKNKTGKNI